MNKFLRKISVLLIGVIASSMLFVSCSSTQNVKKDVEKGATEVKDNIKKGVEDVKNGVEDITGKGKDQQVKPKQEAALVGTWKGKKAGDDKYTITFYEDSSYEIIEHDMNGKEKNLYSGKYVVEGDRITLSRDKEKKSGKVMNSRKLTTITYNLENSNKITIKDEGKVATVLNKENHILNKTIK